MRCLVTALNEIRVEALTLRTKVRKVVHMPWIEYKAINAKVAAQLSDELNPLAKDG